MGKWKYWAAGSAIQNNAYNRMGAKYEYELDVESIEKSKDEIRDNQFSRYQKYLQYMRDYISRSIEEGKFTGSLKKEVIDKLEVDELLLISNDLIFREGEIEYNAYSSDNRSKKHTSLNFTITSMIEKMSIIEAESLGFKIYENPNSSQALKKAEEELAKKENRQTKKIKINYEPDFIMETRDGRVIYIEHQLIDSKYKHFQIKRDKIEGQRAIMRDSNIPTFLLQQVIESNHNGKAEYAFIDINDTFDTNLDVAYGQYSKKPLAESRKEFEFKSLDAVLTEIERSAPIREHERLQEFSFKQSKETVDGIKRYDLFNLDTKIEAAKYTKPLKEQFEIHKLKNVQIENREIAKNIKITPENAERILIEELGSLLNDDKEKRSLQDMKFKAGKIAYDVKTPDNVKSKNDPIWGRE